MEIRYEILSKNNSTLHKNALKAETYEDDWHVVRAFDARDLLAKRTDVKKSLTGSKRIDHHKTLPILDIEVAH